MTAPSPDHRLLIDLCLRHLIPFAWFGPGLLLVDRKGLPQLLAHLEGRSIEVIGLEGFEIEGHDVRPRLDLVFDADRLPGFPSPSEVIATWPEDVWVDVTVRRSA